METQSGFNNTPDSWDQNEDGGSGDQDQNVDETAKNLAGLNVNAAPFIPGQNPYAKEFVPSFGSQDQPAEAGKLIP